MKRGTANTVLTRIDINNSCNFLFNFNTKTFTNTGANVISASFQEFPNNWFRLICTGNVTSTAWSCDIGNMFSEPANSSLYIWGAQMELGFGTSYIRTDGAMVTRVADFANKSGLSGSLGQTQGTIIFDFIYREPKISTGGQLGITANSGVSNNCIVLWNNSTLNTIAFLLRANGVAVANNINLGVFTYNTRNKIAIAYNSGDIVVYVNGVQAYTASTVFTFSELLDVVHLGTYDVILEPNINIYSLYAYQTRLSNSELITRTT